MPFINVSCQGMKMSVSGMDLATGATLKTKDPWSGQTKDNKIDVEPCVAIALGAAALGLLVDFAKGSFARIINGIAGGAGVAFLLLFQNKINKGVMEQGGGMIAVTYDVGFWLVLILFALAVVVSLYAVLFSGEGKSQ